MIFKPGQDVLEISDPIDFGHQARALREAIESRTGTPMHMTDEGLGPGAAECDAAVAWWRQGTRSLEWVLVQLRDEYLREHGRVLLVIPAEGQDGHISGAELQYLGDKISVASVVKKPYKPEGADRVASLLIKAT